MAEPFAPEPDGELPPPGRSPTPIRFAPPIRCDEIAAVVARVAERMAAIADDPVVVRLDDARQPGLPVVDALARLVLAARRTGRPLRFADLSPEILELIELCGLSRLFGLAGAVDQGSVDQAGDPPPPGDPDSGGQVIR